MGGFGEGQLAAAYNPESHSFRKLTMHDTLRDPMWQFVGALAAIAALVVAIVAFIMQRRRKQLSYEIISNASVLTREESIAGKLEILFEQKPVKDVQLIEVKLVNSGSLPITAADYEQPVVLLLGDARVLAYEVTKTTPKTLKASFTLRDEGLSLTPLLLNTGDSVSIRLLVAGYDSAISVDGRIVGVSTIREVHPQYGWSLRAFATSLFGALVGVAIAVHSSKIPVRPRALGAWVFLSAMGALLYVLGRYAGRFERKLFSWKDEMHKQ